MSWILYIGNPMEMFTLEVPKWPLGGADTCPGQFTPGTEQRLRF